MLSDPRPAASRPSPILVLLAAGLLPVACDDGPSEPVHQLRELAEAREVWEDRGPASYVYTYALNCFCVGPGVPPVRITVTDGRVTDAFVPSEDRRVPPSELSTYPTVVDLFEDVSDWLGREPASARTEFHPILGYPVDVFVDFETNVADEELGFRIDALDPA